MTIGELAQAAGVRISTLRFYERRGLLKPRSRSRAGYRNFSEADGARVRFLRRAQELGFSLEELRAMLKLSERRTLVTSDIARSGNAKLAEIDARIADLTRVREALAGLLSAQCIEPDLPCPIIEALDSGPPTLGSHRARGASSRSLRGTPLRVRTSADSSR